MLTTHRGTHVNRLSSEIAKVEASFASAVHLNWDLEQSQVRKPARVSPAARLITHATSFEYQQVSWLVDRRIVASAGPLEDVLVLLTCGDEQTSLPCRRVKVEELEAWIAAGLVELEGGGSALDYNLSCGWSGLGGEAASQPEDGA